MKWGDYCRTKDGAPARYLRDGLCLWVSAMSNDLCVSEVGEEGSSPGLPHASDEAVLAACAVIRFYNRRHAP